MALNVFRVQSVLVAATPAEAVMASPVLFVAEHALNRVSAADVVDEQDLNVEDPCAAVLGHVKDMESATVREETSVAIEVTFEASNARRRLQLPQQPLEQQCAGCPPLRTALAVLAMAMQETELEMALVKPQLDVVVVHCP